MKKILIISHRDADGITSAVSYVWNYLESINVSKNIKNIYKYADIIDYENGEDIDNIFKKKKINLKNYSQLVITDLCFSLEKMLFFQKLFKDDFIWIDHHKRSDEEIDNKIKKKIKGIRDHKKAACFLVWKYFKKGAPEFVKYIQDMDIWIFKMEMSKEFNAGIENLKTPFTKKNINYVLKLLDFDYFNSVKEKIIEKGKTVLKSQKTHVVNLLYAGKIINFFNKKTFIINSEFSASIFSDVFFNLKDRKYKNVEILVVWHKNYKINKFKFSLRRRDSSKTDLSLIAKKFGGAGHPGAAGFSLKSLSDFKYD